MAQLLDTAFDVSGTVPLGPQAKIARALVDTKNQEGARKGLNYGQSIILGIATVIAFIIAIGLLVAAGTSDTPNVQDGRWYGGWSVLVLAAIPLSILTGFTIYKNQDCRGDVVGLIVNNAPGKIGSTAQAIEQF